MSNTRPIMSSVIPIPVSEIEIRTRPREISAASVMQTLRSEYFAALFNRFAMTCARRVKSPSVSTMGRPASYTDTLAIFTEHQALGLASEPLFLHGDVFLSSDTRGYPGHPTNGGFYQATWFPCLPIRAPADTAFNGKR